MGQFVRRTFNLNRESFYAGVGTVTISSDVHTDFRGNTLGSGQDVGSKITRTAATGWEIALFSARRTSNLFDISSRTTSPIQVTGALTRDQRIVNGGALEVIHNKAKFVATWTPKQMAYRQNCCHPISGSARVDYTGSISGSGEIFYTDQCGKARVVNYQNNEEITATLDACI